MGSDQKRALIAVVISGIFLFGWQKIYSPVQNKNNDPATINNAGNDKISSRIEDSRALKAKVSESKSTSDVSKFLIDFESKTDKLKIENSLTLREYESSRSLFDFRDVVGSGFETSFFVEKNGVTNKLIITSKDAVNGNYPTNIPDVFVNITTLNGQPEIKIISDDLFKLSLEFKGAAERTDNGSFRKLKTFFKGEVQELEFGEEDALISSTNWFAVDHNYHIFALVGKESKSFKAISSESGLIRVNINEPSTAFEFDLFFVKKNYDYLKSLNNGLSATIEFGFFGFLAVPILRMLQFFYEYFPNYGVSIIILTLLIRLFTFPLQYKSFKSMKKMQKLQPELNKLKEKYQDNPQKMQAETMELFKRSGANPLGGCLPMLLQMPFFFAFYKVLSAAVELVGAPFIFWINDLSTKDPYFVLPVLLAIVMFGQQKLTPTQTADATQQKVMMFMPVVFGFIMKDLPSGLVLYIFISTLFGILQQLYVYKQAD